MSSCYISPQDTAFCGRSRTSSSSFPDNMCSSSSDEAAHVVPSTSTTYHPSETPLTAILLDDGISPLKHDSPPPPTQKPRTKTSLNAGNEWYIILPSPSRGGGLGVFARRRIPRGTRLMVEPALFTVPLPGDVHAGKGYDMEGMVDGIVAAVDALDLETGGGEGRRMFEEAWEMVHPGEEDFVDAGTSDDADPQNVDEEERRREGRSRRAKYMRIFRTNAYTLPSSSNPPPSSSSPAADRVGMFPLVARINHSCAPNAANVWDPLSGGNRVIWASRDIEAGEEVLVSYAPLLRDTAARRERLRQYGFECACEVCGDGGGDTNEEEEGKRAGDTEGKSAAGRKKEDAVRRRLGRDLAELEGAAQHTGEGVTVFMNKRLAKQAGKLAEQLRAHGNGELWGYLEQVYDLAALFWERAGDEEAAENARMKADEMRAFGRVGSL